MWHVYGEEQWNHCRSTSYFPGSMHLTWSILKKFVCISMWGSWSRLIWRRGILLFWLIIYYFLIYCRRDVPCLFYNTSLLLNTKGATYCTAQHAFPADSACAEMTDSCVHVKDDVIPWPANYKDENLATGSSRAEDDIDQRGIKSDTDKRRWVFRRA